MEKDEPKPSTSRPKRNRKLNPNIYNDDMDFSDMVSITETVKKKPRKPAAASQSNDHSQVLKI